MCVCVHVCAYMCGVYVLVCLCACVCVYTYILSSKNVLQCNVVQCAAV